jgi:MFS family permease
MRVMGAGVSNTIFPLLSGAMVLIAWQMPFLLYALAIPIGLAVFRWYDDPTTGTVSTDGGSSVNYRRELWKLVQQPRVVAFLLGRGSTVWAWVGFVTYNSLIVGLVLERGPATAGLLTATGSIGFALFAGSAGRLSGRFSTQKLLLLGFLLEIIGFGLVLVSSYLPLTVLGTLLLGGGFGLLMSVYRSLFSQLASQDLRAGLVSLAEAGGQTVATMVPVALGGIVFVSQPVVGERLAIQLAGLGALLIGGVGGLSTLVVAWLYRTEGQVGILNNP